MGEGIRQGLKPSSLAGFIAKAKALAYLEARIVDAKSGYPAESWTKSELRYREKAERIASTLRNDA